jgi:hypothetical protein
MKYCNIHVCVSSISFEYFKRMFQNYEKLKSSDYLLSWNFYCVDKQIFDYFDSQDAIVYPVYGGQKGSDTHGKAFKLALQNMRTSGGDFDVFADTDTMMVEKDWTATVEKQLQSVDIFATQFERVGSVCAGDGPIQMYKKLPALTWFAVSKKCDLSAMETSVDKQNHLLIDTEEKAKIYNLPIGFSVLRDTGWQIPEFIHNNHISYACLEMHKPNLDFVKVLSNKFTYSEENWIEGTERPFVCHCRGSCSKPVTHELPTEFYKNINEYLEKGNI